MDPNDNTSVADTEANTALSPSATEGTSSSEVVNDAPINTEEAIRKEFLETYGEGDPVEAEEPEDLDAGSAEDGDDAEGEEADDASDTQKSEDEPEAVTPLDADDAEDDKFRIPDDEFKKLPQGVKQRLGHLNARAKKAERENADLSRELEPLRDAHTRFTQLQSFVHDNNIQSENVTIAFDAMAKMSAGDFEGFIKLVQPWYTQAQQALGSTIAPDLQSRVDDGYLTEEDAREMTKARTRAQMSESRVADMEKRTKAQAAASTQERTRTSIITSINDREAHYKSSDPDFALKRDAIWSTIEFAISRGALPKTAEEAIKMVDDAHAAVTKSFAPARQKPKQTPPRPSVSSPATGSPPPTNTLDAITQGLRAIQG